MKIYLSIISSLVILIAMFTFAPIGVDSTAGVNSFRNISSSKISYATEVAVSKITPAAVAKATSSTWGDELVAKAKTHLGATYVYGANGPTTFDCSGLIQYVYKELGMSIVRTTYEQVALGAHVELKDIMPGDLVFCHKEALGPGHVVMYVGNNNVIAAPQTGDVVKIESLELLKPIVDIRRVPKS